MMIKFSHVNIVAKDWKKLAKFYIKVFGCTPKPPERDLSGIWIDKLTNLQGARIQGIHLLLPGFDSDGPTLEIFEYNNRLTNSQKTINLEGIAHIAFAVDDVRKTLNFILDNGGSALGDLVNSRIEGMGEISVVYAKDPEGNIIEIQKWG